MFGLTPTSSKNKKEAKDPSFNPKNVSFSIDKLLVRDRKATYLYKVEDDNLSKFGYLKNDYVLVDTSLPIKNGDLIVALLDNEVFICKYFLKNNKPILYQDHDIYLDESVDVQIIGPIISMIRRF